MMPGKFKLAAFGLLAVGVLLMLAALFTGSPQTASVKPAAPTTVAMVVAKMPIVFGKPISAEMVSVEQVNVKPQGAFSDPKEVIGRTPILGLGAGLPLTESLFVIDGVAAQVRSGYRALAIRVDDNTSNAGKIKPGDIVDIFSMLKKDDREVSNSQSRLLIPRVRVLSVGNQVVGQQAVESKDPANQPQPGSVRSVIVELDVRDVNATVVAQQQGLIFLALRNPEDEAVPEREAFPEPLLLTKKKTEKGKPAPSNTPDDDAFAGLGVIGGIAAGPAPKQTQAAAAAAPVDPNRPKSEPANTVEVIRRGTPKTERAQ